MINTSIWVAWAVVLICVVNAIILLTGRGSFLIAGYNTASKEQKQKFNQKKLCRVMGAGLGVIAVMLGVATAYRFEMPTAIAWIIPWGLFGVIGIILVLANTICKNNPS